MYLLKTRIREIFTLLAFEIYALMAHKVGKIKFLLFGSQLPNHVHLGCGQVRMKHFANVDILSSPATDLTMDLRRKFHFADQSIELFFSEHVFEHLHPYELQNVFAEIKRCLKKNGRVLFSLPDFELLHNEYKKKQSPIFTSYIKDLKRFGIHFEGKNARLLYFNHALHQAGEHKFYYNFEYLKELLQGAGFKRVNRRQFIPKIDSYHRQNFSLFIEAV